MQSIYIDLKYDIVRFLLKFLKYDIVRFLLKFVTGYWNVYTYDLWN